MVQLNNLHNTNKKVTRPSFTLSKRHAETKINSKAINHKEDHYTILQLNNKQGSLPEYLYHRDKEQYRNK